MAIIDRALDKVDRRGFDPADIAAGEKMLTEQAPVFPPEDLRLLADRVVDGIDPDGTLPNDQLNERPAVLSSSINPGRSLVGDLRLTGTLGAKLQAVLDPWRNPGSPGRRGRRRTYGQRMHDALEDICDRKLRAGTYPTQAVSRRR